MEKKLNTFFKQKSKKLRQDFISALHDGFKYHIGGTLSCIDITTVLFYGNFINLKNKNRNIFILSKGHALACLYLTLIDKKIINYRYLKNGYRNLKLGGQLDIFNSKFVDWNTGSLGHSIGVSIGLAIKNPKKKIYLIVGDAEFEEGSVWEAIFFISEKKIKNIMIIIDRNNMSATSEIKKKDIFTKKIIDQLNLKVNRIDGHNFNKIYEVLNNFKKKNVSNILITNTIKGKGFRIFENNKKYSHEMPKSDILKKLLCK